VASLKVIPAIVTHVTVALSVCMCVCRLSHSCTLLKPLNEMPVGRDTRVVPGNKLTLY